MRNFLSDQRGNMAIMFAATTMVLMAGIGAAVDYSGMISKKSRFQDYADMAVLAAATSDLESLSDLRKIASNIVDTNNISKTKLKTKLTILANGTYHVDINARCKIRDPKTCCNKFNIRY